MRMVFMFAKKPGMYKKHLPPVRPEWQSKKPNLEVKLPLPHWGRGLGGGALERKNIRKTKP
jgi:hypothetical protein